MLRVIFRDFAEVFGDIFCVEMWEMLKALLACPVEFYKLFRPFSTVILTIAVIVIVVARRKYLNSLPVRTISLPPYLEGASFFSEIKILHILKKIGRKEGWRLKYEEEKNANIVVPDEQGEGEE